MAAMKPRTGDGPMEAEREPRGLIVLRVPLEGGGRWSFPSTTMRQKPSTRSLRA
jgi:hypothetical protein